MLPRAAVKVAIFIWSGKNGNFSGRNGSRSGNFCMERQKMATILYGVAVRAAAAVASEFVWDNYFDGT